MWGKSKPEKSVSALQELPPPPIMAGNEVLRAFISSADSSLNVSIFSAFKEPGHWGVLLADVARHAARSYAQDGICTEDEALSEIQQLWKAEFKSPTDLGVTKSVLKQ